MQYSSSTLIVDNLQMPDNGHSSLHEVVQFRGKMLWTVVGVANPTLLVIMNADSLANQCS